MARGLESSEFFDADWYLQQYPDVAHSGLTPLEHYLKLGVVLKRDPSPLFSTGFYLHRHPDVERAGLNPLQHYVNNGRSEGREIAPAGWCQTPDEPHLPVARATASTPATRSSRVVSFYLPQFHPIPENDAWWGEGFTEWTNVRPAKPQFPGHYQPHVPGDLGYYDLRDTEVQRQQVELAKQYGVDAFCFYFYWFAGERLLETPIRNYLDDPSLDLPFMLCWANENWSRRWDGKEHDVLMAQDHSPEDDLAFIEYIAPYLRDERYVRVDGKPVLLVYRPSLLPDIRETAERWRAWCRDNGIGEIHLAYTQSFESADPRDYGFDAAIEFPPNNTGVPDVTRHLRAFAGFEGRRYDWDALVDRSDSYTPSPFPLYRGTTPSWDNTARRKSGGAILSGSTPGRFTRWLTNAMRDARTHATTDDAQFVFVNAWNEWAEGAHLEPDQRYGYAWLESVSIAHACAGELPALPFDASPKVFVDLTGQPITRAVLRNLRALETYGCDVLAIVPPGTSGAVRRGAGVTGVESATGIGSLDVLECVRDAYNIGVELVAVIGAAALGTKAVDELLDSEKLPALVARFAADHTLGLVHAANTHRGDASPHEWAMAGRLGLRDDEASAALQWSGEAFIARSRALLPAASITFSPDATAAPERDEGARGTFNALFTLSATAMAVGVSDTSGDASAAGRPTAVVVTHDAYPHGAQRLALHLAKEYVRLGFGVEIISLGPGPMLDEYAAVAPTHLVDHPGGFARLRPMLLELKRRGPVFAVVNTTVSAPILPVAKQCGIPTISLVHEMPSVLAQYDLAANARVIARNADHVIFPARIVQDGFTDFLGDDVTQAAIRPQGLYLHNPHEAPEDIARVRTEVRRALKLKRDSEIVLAVGYADERKGVDLFAAACVKILKNHRTAVAVWAGHGIPEQIDNAMAVLRAAGVEGRVHFVGMVDNPQDFYTASDVYLLTSREDPFPSVVLEAMDAGVPVVAFAGLTGSEELIRRDGGVLVPALDTDAMAEATLRFLRSPNLRTDTGQAGRKLVEDEFQFRSYALELADRAGAGFPRVSAIVPNYNYEQYIVDRLTTVTGQTVPLHELIVLDDVSSDNSVARIRDFLSECSVPASLTVNETNSGNVFRQWIRGVEQATGEFVWIAEADDLADADFLAELLPFFDDPEVVMAFSQSRQMASDGSILCEHYLDYVADIDPEKWTNSYVVDGSEEIQTALFIKNTIPNASAVLFRREALLATLREHADEIMSFRNAGDWVTYLRVLERGKVAFSPRSLNSHRRHASSVTLSSFNVGQLAEIVGVQHRAISEHRLGPHAEAKAVAYAQKLYKQFGLDSATYPRFTDHPELRGAAAHETASRRDRNATVEDPRENAGDPNKQSREG